MKKYESVIIFDDAKMDASGESYSKDMVSFIEGTLKGKVTLSESMGRKVFSAPIKKRNAGLYWNIMFQVEPSQVKVLKEKYRLDENIMRMEVILDETPENPITMGSKK